MAFLTLVSRNVNKITGNEGLSTVLDGLDVTETKQLESYRKNCKEVEVSHENSTVSLLGGLSGCNQATHLFRLDMEVKPTDPLELLSWLGHA